MVTPARTRNVPVSSSSLTQGTTTRTVPVQEIVIAVEPEEVALLNEAMDLKYEITCVARSGRPCPFRRLLHSVGGTAGAQVLAAFAKAFRVETARRPGKATSAPTNENRQPTKTETSGKDQVAMDITPGLNPMAEIRFMEVMIGTQRQFVLFTGPGNSPVVASQDDGSAKAGSGGVRPVPRKRASNETRD